MSFILSIIFYWIQQGKLAILILYIKIQEKYSFRSILPSYAAYNLDVFRSGPEAFTGMALYPASAWKIPYSAARPSLFTYVPRVPSALFPRVPQLPSRSRFTSFSCITAPVAVHTAVSLYSWSHANINVGFLTAQVLSSRRVRPLLFTFCFTFLLSLPSIPFLYFHNFYVVYLIFYSLSCITVHVAYVAHRFLLLISF